MSPYLHLHLHSSLSAVSVSAVQQHLSAKFSQTTKDATSLSLKVWSSFSSKQQYKPYSLCLVLMLKKKKKKILPKIANLLSQFDSIYLWLASTRIVVRRRTTTNLSIINTALSWFSWEWLHAWRVQFLSDTALCLYSSSWSSSCLWSSTWECTGCSNLCVFCHWQCVQVALKQEKKTQVGIQCAPEKMPKRCECTLSIRHFASMLINLVRSSLCTVVLLNSTNTRISALFQFAVVDSGVKAAELNSAVLKKKHCRTVLFVHS